MALSSDAHRPQDVGADYEQALELLEELGVRELCVFERRVRRLEPIGARAAQRPSVGARGQPEAGERSSSEAGTMSPRGSAMTPTAWLRGRRLVIGGVEIPHERGLDGHSDADVLAHAVIDALLGAAGLGDIGEHFPDTDERWRDADSIALLRAGRRELVARERAERRERRLHRGDGGAEALPPPRGDPRAPRRGARA